MSSGCKEYPLFPPCTGHGVCLAGGICKCDEGWASIGDLSSNPGDHCGIHITAVKVLFIIPILPYLFVFYLSGKLIKTRIELIKESKKNKQNQRKQSLSWTEPIALFPLCFLMSSTSGLIFSVLKIIDPVKYSAGVDITTTILFYLHLSFSLGGACVYLLVLIKFLAGYAKMMPSKVGEMIKKESDIVHRAAKITGYSLFVISFIPFIIIAYPKHDIECGIALGVSLLLVDVFIGFFLLRYLSIMSKELKDHLDNINHDKANNNISNHEKLVSVKNKIDKAFALQLFISINAGILFLVLIISPFAIKNSSYFGPGFFTGTATLAIIFNFSIMNDAKRNATSNTPPNSGNITDKAITPIGEVNHLETSTP